MNHEDLIKAIAWLQGYRKALIEQTQNERLQPREQVDYEHQVGVLQGVSMALRMLGHLEEEDA